MSWFDRNFDRELVIYLDRKMLAGITEHARAEMDLFIRDALHASDLFGPRTFIVFREADYNQFEIGGAGVSREVDDTAWAKVVYYVKNAHAVSRMDQP